MNTPEGWKLVPVEPTQEMQSAAERYARHHNRVPFSAGYYRAMLAAAPTPPEQPAAQGELTDRGPWKVTEVGNLQSDDFEHDVTLQISGDFEFEDQRLAYADGLCNLLNSSIAANDAARKRPEAEVAEIMEAVRKLAVLSCDFAEGDCTGSAVDAAFAEVERLARGVGS